MSPVRLAFSVVVLSLICIGVTPSAAIAEPAFMLRFAGSWTGTGHTRTDISDSPRNVKCKATGKGGQSAFNLTGICTAYGIFSRSFGAEIAFDTERGIYSGVYIGSRSGPSQLAGQLSGDVLRLDVTWPRVINGDRKAVMVLRNGGDGSFSLEVRDRAPGGEDVATTTSIRFTRQ